MTSHCRDIPVSKHDPRLTIVFGYGALMSPHMRERRGIIAHHEQDYCLHSFRVQYTRIVPNLETSKFFNPKYPVKTYPYFTMLNISQTKKKKDIVFGKLIWVDDEGMRRIRKLENGYKLKTFTRNGQRVYFFMTVNPEHLTRREEINHAHPLYLKLVSEQQQDIRQHLSQHVPLRRNLNSTPHQNRRRGRGSR